MCTFWGIASGLVGAVVVLMGVIAFNPMLNAGYDVKLASGVITAGGTLGILIPPSVMMIVYAAVAGQSIVKLYAAAMLPGFFLAFLYLVYILGWAILNPKIAPKLPEGQYRTQVPEWLQRLERGRSRRVLGGLIATALRPGLLRELERRTAAGRLWPDRQERARAMVPLMLTVGHVRHGLVVRHHLQRACSSDDRSRAVSPAQGDGAGSPPKVRVGTTTPGCLRIRPWAAEEKPQELGAAETTVESTEPSQPLDAPPEQMGSLAEPTGTSAAGKIPEHFYAWFGGFVALAAVLLAIYYWRMDGDQLEILKELVVSVVPLGVLTVVVLAVILFGITTATESAAIGALGALYLAVMAKFARQVWWWSLVGAIVGVVLGWPRGGFVTLLVSGCLWRDICRDSRALVLARADLAGALAEPQGVGVPHCEDDGDGLLALCRLGAFLRRLRVARWPGTHRALGAGYEPVAGWVPDHIAAHHLPAGLAARVDRDHRDLLPDLHSAAEPLPVDPILFGTMVAVNLQAAFLSPPVAMSAFYLKGVAPKHVTLNQIFAGMMPYMIIVCICLAFMYIWPGMTLWLPEFLYGYRDDKRRIPAFISRRASSTY